MGAQGTAVINFGSTPTFEGSVVVTGQASITAGAHIEPFWQVENTTEQYDMAPYLLKVAGGSIVDGTGFTIFASSLFPVQGQITVRWVWN